MNIFFQYNNKTIKIPINPEEFTVPKGNKNETVEIIGLGDVNIIKNPHLMTYNIESFFPFEDNPQEYIDFFEQAIKDEKPIKIVYKEFNLNTLVSINKFEYTGKAGEENDRYYTLELMEWVDTKPILVSIIQPPKQQEQKQEQKQEPPKEVKPPTEVKKGDIVKFNGGRHYRSSVTDTPTGKPRTAGNAQVTLINKGSKHPYHLIGVKGGSDVYGWVDEESFTK